MKTLDPLATPLKGLSLVEASAGTGKTYAISNLYLQLLVEKGFAAEEILVVTFTKAATEELKGRIRGRIVDAINSLSGVETSDDFLQGFFAKTADHERALRSLTNALRSFDLAAIFTIHGFCLRTLYNHAFESSSLFDTRLVEDQTEVLLEIVDDFWRKNFYPMEPSTFKALAQEITREKLLALAKICISNPLLAIEDNSPTDRKGPVDPDNVTLSVEALRRKFIDYVLFESARRKRRENVRSYDDLLIDLFRALEGLGGNELARSIRSRYKAALVDEFQDTDPLQYKIFRTIYSGSEGALFLIGDPKQSIYSFRGADIFSYMEAVNDVDNQYTLGKNWRSAKELIKAVNVVFGGSVNPFIFEPLTFQPVEPGKDDETSELTIDGVRDQSPFKIWFLKRESEKKNTTKGVARSLVGRAVGQEIVALLMKGSRGEACIDGRPVHAGDIAILVHTNWEAREMFRILKDFRVPGVIYSAESVFGSHEAMEMERFLMGVLEPSSESYVKSALSTDLLGLTGDDLADLEVNEKRWDDWVGKFESYRSVFLSQGFIAMARDVLTREGVKQRLMAFPDGERRVTNVLHCIELLHSASIEEKLGMEGLLKWLQEKRREKNDGNTDEYQIRLETDEKAVKIVTVHKSKGLEYPIVFCPYSWNSAIRDKEGLVVYHDDEKWNRPTLNIGFPAHERARRSMEIEQLAENVRLLYVTLTRAKYRCYLAWGAINESETSALAYLLHLPKENKKSVNLGEVKDFMRTLGDDRMVEDIVRLVDASEGAIELTSIPEPTDLIYTPPRQISEMLECRQFTGEIEKDWRTTSFTALISGREQLSEIPDRDAGGVSVDLVPALKSERPSGQGNSIFDFPRGARAGTCIHDIFEHIDFSLGDPVQGKGLVREKLAEYGFEERWIDTVYGAIKNVLYTPVMTKEDPFTLSRLAPSDRLHEVEFYVPLGLISPERLGRVFSAHSGGIVKGRFASLIKALGFIPHQGMLKGFIDMIFHVGGRYYLVDWKSNFLGENIEDYERGKLDGAMEKDLYILQYHIYAVALHQFLALRLHGYSYNQNFGGVLYLFIRGMDPSRGSGYGVFFDKPELALIESLASCLAGRASE